MDGLIGLELLIDGTTNDYKIRDISAIYHFLKYFPEKLGMKRISAPTVMSDSNGYIGVVIIAESHILVHTFIDQSYITIDIFSCKPFDIDKAIYEVKKFFKLETENHTIIKRGTK